MTTYTYMAKRPDGSDVRGTIDAATLDAAREELRKQGLALDDIQPKPTPLPWSGTTAKAASISTVEPEYAPLHETIRIFAGWLLAWYGVIYALGFLVYTQKLPELPFVSELFTSRLVLQFTFGTFLFLALSNIHRWMGGGLAKGIALTVAYLLLLAGFVVYG